MNIYELEKEKRFEYLNKLIDKTNDFAKHTAWIDTRDQATKVEYAKNICDFSTGIDIGIAHIDIEKKCKVKRTKKLGTKKIYLKYYYDGDTLTYIENYVNELNLIFEVVYDGNIRYLIPFYQTGMPYPTYIHAAKIENGRVIEEWQVKDNEIIYECYSYYSNGSDVYYDLINYAKGGKRQILMKKNGWITDDYKWKYHSVTTYSDTSDTIYIHQDDGLIIVYEWDGKEKLKANGINFCTEKENEKLIADAVIKTGFISFYYYKSIDISKLILPGCTGILFSRVKRIEGLSQFMKNNPSIKYYSFDDMRVSYLDERFFSSLSNDSKLIFDNCRGLKSIKGLKGILTCNLFCTRIEDKDIEPLKLCKHSVFKRRDYGLED